MSPIGNEVFRELTEYKLMRFPHDVGQDVKAPPVGHPHDDFLNPLVRALLEDRVKGRYRDSPPSREKRFCPT